jgi:hypothetical protein
MPTQEDIEKSEKECGYRGYLCEPHGLPSDFRPRKPKKKKNKKVKK